MSALNLEDPSTVYALVALDNELNQLHRLCIEQGPFFKVLFEETTTDALRQRLKQHVRGQAANGSHVSRSYWKQEIPHSDVEAIRDMVDGFRRQWTAFYTPRQRAEFNPPSSDSNARSALRVLDTDLAGLTLGILEACRYLLAAPAVQRARVEAKLQKPPNAQHRMEQLLVRLGPP